MASIGATASSAGRVAASGTRTPSTVIVMMIAITPSLKASRREVSMGSGARRLGGALLGEPGGHPADGLLDLGRGDREAQADEVAALDGVEIDAGGGGDAGRAQQLFAEGQAVGGHVAHVGPDVEGA